MEVLQGGAGTQNSRLRDHEGHGGIISIEQEQESRLIDAYIRWLCISQPHDDETSAGVPEGRMRPLRSTLIQIESIQFQVNESMHAHLRDA